MNTIEWSQRLREAHESQTGDRRRIRLPVSQGISFEGPDDSVTISLSGTSVSEGNMQTDGAAFEAWAVALKEWCGVKRLCLHWQSPLESPGETGRASAHYERFLYRVQRFRELFPDWFTVDQPERLEGARALGPGPLCLNLAGDRRGGGLSGALDAASSSGPQEHVLELALKDAVDFKAHFGPMEKVARQWPVGLFAGPVPKRTDAIFTGGKSAIDLVGIGGTTLWVFELKAGRNAPAGKPLASGHPHVQADRGCPDRREAPPADRPSADRRATQGVGCQRRPDEPRSSTAPLQRQYREADRGGRLRISRPGGRAIREVTAGVSLTVHRSAHEIGGNCIELSAGDSRILLDIGRPLDAPEDSTRLLPRTLDLERPLAGVLISHPHQDHYGLLCEAPADWPVFCGEGTRRLMAITEALRRRALAQTITTWRSGRWLEIGPFRITPRLTDHSAFDAHMLLIEVAGKRILYSGDFRTHGRKSALPRGLMAYPPRDLDVLVMEGTNLGSAKPTQSEKDLEADFVRLFKETPGRVFVAWSAQNIDRTVTMYRACKRTGRTLVVDLYTASVLEALADLGTIPQPSWDHLTVVITKGLRQMYARTGQEEFVARAASHGISASKMARDQRNWVVMVRPSLIPDFVAKGIVPTPQDAWSYSMWRGYLDKEDGKALQSWFEAGGSRAVHLHTSGHASPADLRAFARAMSPKLLIPVHGLGWDAKPDGFPAIQRVKDGETLSL
jgi:ribonuclease J